MNILAVMITVMVIMMMMLVLSLLRIASERRQDAAGCCSGQVQSWHAALFANLGY